MNQKFVSQVANEIKRIDSEGVTKRNENIIEDFTKEASPKAIIKGKAYRIFNSNDYLGLRFNKELLAAEEHATQQFGTGPGAVRFISGTLKIHRDLENVIAKFHKRDDAIVFSSAFAANIAVMACFLNKQSKDSLLSNDVVVISDALNHRSIIDGIRAASIDKPQKQIYQHMDYNNLSAVLEQNKTQYKRAVVISDGVFSMIGEFTDIKKLRKIVDKYDKVYQEGVLLIIDDSHGVGAFGKTGRGCEEVSEAKADLLVATFGKAFGSDGGYVVGDQVLIDYLRESAATYIYSNSVSPGVAAAALKAVSLIDAIPGKALLAKLSENISYFQKQIQKAGFQFVVNSIHPIQPLLVGDTLKTKKLKETLYTSGILVTNINYPVVAKGKDEIRIQINASHTKEDIAYFVTECTEISKKLQII
ncbi:MAG TPA: aminotransferase class I/II-fold pyridoxal phosphate-dependent enzyme [Candidatus Sulfotelmatobacter sp.]|jgi:glycine C-acetyltransferase|nr:aminotransferase class I/II-fold pyridoxal phosphate-dependent enzyme [Candidatus Sulfotelmatobacter sp.]